MKQTAEKVTCFITLHCGDQGDNWQHFQTFSFNTPLQNSKIKILREKRKCTTMNNSNMN
jgi:hypothetical protein